MDMNRVLTSCSVDYVPIFNCSYCWVLAGTLVETKMTVHHKFPITDDKRPHSFYCNFILSYFCEICKRNIQFCGDCLYPSTVLRIQRCSFIFFHSRRNRNSWNCYQFIIIAIDRRSLIVLFLGRWGKIGITNWIMFALFEFDQSLDSLSRA